MKIGRKNNQRGGFIMKNTNKGFSLVEVLVVLAIVAVITTLATISISIVNNANASKAANKFETLLNNSRATSITKGSEAGKLIITKENGKLYGQIGENSEKELICSGKIKVYFNKYNSVVSYYDRQMTTEIADGEKYVIKFNTAGSAIDMSADIIDGGDNFCKMIFANTNRKLEVVLYRQTGKHVINLF